MIMTINTDQLRATHTNFPRLLDGENRSKFIAAVRSPLARDLLNSNVSAQLNKQLIIISFRILTNMMYYYRVRSTR